MNQSKRMLMNTTLTLALAALPALGAAIHMKPEEAPQPATPAPPFRLHGGVNYLPAFDPAQVIPANMADHPTLILEIPPGGKLTVATKPSGKLPGSRYAVMTKQTKTFKGQSALSNLLVANRTNRSTLVEVSFRPIAKYNDGLAIPGLAPLELTAFNVLLTRNWDPSAPSPLAQRETLTSEALGGLPELAFQELEVRCRPLGPVYPPDAEAAKVEGKVALLIAVDKDGKPIQVQCTSGPEPLRAAAISYVMRWLFVPPIAEGRNQTVKVPLTLAFRLK